MKYKASDIVKADLNYILESLETELEKLAGKNILITGGAGFLGYYLVQTIVEWNRRSENNHINTVIYDNFVRGVPEWLTSLKSEKYLTLKKHDITDPLPHSDVDFQYIIHAAAIASPTYYRQYPLETMDANVNGLRYLLDYARNLMADGKPFDGFLFFSTSEIYGDPQPEFIPTPETYRGNVSCTGPRACYDESKRYGETLCITYAQQYNLPVSIARPFNNYGPGLKITDRRVIPDFVRDVLEGKNIVMFSDGKPSRTFCYSADAIIGYIKVLVNGYRGHSYNIGVDEPEITMRELAEKIVRLAQQHTGYTGRVEFRESPDADYLVDNPNRRCPVIDKARTEIGYNPGIGFDDGLLRSFLWYMDNREGTEA